MLQSWLYGPQGMLKRLFSLLLSIVLLSACYLHRDPASLTLAVAVPELPAKLDPHLDSRLGGRSVHAAVFDALTTIDPDGTLKPALATSWHPIGPTTWEFKLRTGVRFASGEEFNAHTVAANVRRVLRPSLQSPVLKEIPTLLRANPRDLYTIVISTRRPDPILPRRLAALYLVPLEHASHVGDDDLPAPSVGTGPWRFGRFAPGEELTLEARKGSWRGLPQVRIITLRQLALEADRATALLEGRAQVALDVAPQRSRELQDRGMAVYESPVAASRLITLETAADDAPLENSKVRQALNFAVDKDRLINDIVGAGLPLDGQVVGKDAYGYSEMIQTTYPFNPNEAQRLLAEAGFPNGFTMRINYARSPDEREQRELQAIIADLARVGIRVVLQPNNHNTFTNRRLAGLLMPAFYETLPYYATQDASAVMDFFGSDRALEFAPTYENDDFEEIYKLTRSEMNPSLRLQALQVSMGILSEHPPAIFLYQPIQINAMRPDVRDLGLPPSLIVNYDRVSH
jgi:peptide/nickel transport system substrate-binding protein